MYPLATAQVSSGVLVPLAGNHCLTAALHVSRGIVPEQKREQKRVKNEAIKRMEALLFCTYLTLV